MQYTARFENIRRELQNRPLATEISEYTPSTAGWVTPASGGLREDRRARSKSKKTSPSSAGTVFVVQSTSAPRQSGQADGATPEWSSAAPCCRVGGVQHRVVRAANEPVHANDTIDSAPGRSRDAAQGRQPPRPPTSRAWSSRPPYSRLAVRRSRRGPPPSSASAPGRVHQPRVRRGRRRHRPARRTTWPATPSQAGRGAGRGRALLPLTVQRNNITCQPGGQRTVRRRWWQPCGHAGSTSAADVLDSRSRLYPDSERTMGLRASAPPGCASLSTRHCRG